MMRARIAASILIIFSLLTGWVGQVALVVSAQPIRAHPLLAQLAAEDPDQQISVIVQKYDSAIAVEATAEKLGARITHDLYMIRSFAARMTPSAALELARDPRVRWISPDSPVVKMDETSFPGGVHLFAGFEEMTFQAGRSGWPAEWVEVGETDGPEVGDVAIANFLAATQRGVRIQGAERGLQSSVDLSAANAAVLGISFRRKDFSSEQDYVKLEISNDGGLTWTTAAHIAGPAGDPGVLFQEIDLTAYLPAILMLRFVSSPAMGAEARFYLDYIQVEYATQLKDRAELPYSLHMPILAAVGSQPLQEALQETSTTSLAVTKTVGDNFSLVGFNNNTGNTAWKTDWFESDTLQPGAASGNVSIQNGELRLQNQGTTNPLPSVARSVDLSGGIFQARLTFTFQTSSGVDPDDVVVLEASASDGVYKPLEYFRGFSGSFSGSRSYDLAALIAANTSLRFRVFSNYTNADEYFSVDDLQVAYAAWTTLDQFNLSVYTGNDGSVPWGANWVEGDPYGGGGSTGGYVRVTNGRLQFNYVWVGYERITRSANLLGWNSAILSFDWQTQSLDTYEWLGVLVSKDGVSPFVQVGAYGGSQSGHASIDISAYISGNAQIRFEPVVSNWEYDDYAFVDNVQITLTRACNLCVNTSTAGSYIKSIRADQVWNNSDYVQGQNVAIAVVDSGIALHGDLGDQEGGSRIVAQAQFTSNATLPDDFYGHGTHVAGAAAGNGAFSAGRFFGAAPRANLVDVKVMDDYGMGMTSDVIAGLQWVYDNRKAYNIRIANLSLNSTVVESYHTSPLDAALEILWFNGIVVIVSAGNNGQSSSGVLFPPANDPFILSIGAVNDLGTASVSDDTLASFSAYGVTSDGYSKPDLVAPGRSIVGPLAADDCNLVIDHPERIIAGSGGNNYFSLSGTSMAAGVAAGAVALLLQDEPGLTPDQVKYRLISTARPFSAGSGAGYMDIYAAVTGTSTQNANTGVTASQLLWTGSDPVVWGSVAWNSVAWNSVAWNSVAWNSVAWNSVAWNSDYWEP